MNPSSWQWLKRMPGLLSAPRPELAEQARRTVRLQRDIVMPAKLVILAGVVYYINFSTWLGEVASNYAVFFETMQDFFMAYVLFTLTMAVSFFVFRRIPPAVVQWAVFAIGLVDGLFLGGLTILTGGFESILYWIFPALILVNAICIPLATPQIILNLLICGMFVSGGWVEVSIREIETTVSSALIRSTRVKDFSGSDIADLPKLASWLKGQADPMSKHLWDQFSPETREKLEVYLETGTESPDLRDELVRESKRILIAPRRVILTEPTEYPTSPYVQKLAVLVLLTFCCYGVQVLAAQKAQVEEEQKEFLVRTEQLRGAGRLAAEFAHQIKNPLAIINNVTFSLQRALKNSAPESRQIDIIREEVVKADQIITQIMGYSQLSEGRVEKLDVTEELNRAIESVFPSGAGLHVQVHRDFNGSIPSLLMQRIHFAEAVGNLLQNAREAVGEKGNISVSAHCHDDYSVAITVADDGPGIPPDKTERIFEAYYTTKERGTGLGLAIVKHNAELYGGNVTVQSELGKGTRFTLLFPGKTLAKLA